MATSIVLPSWQATRDPAIYAVGARLPLTPGGQAQHPILHFSTAALRGHGGSIVADSNDAAPSDGIEQSGLGREAPRLAMDEFTEVKYLCRDEFVVVWAPRRISKRAPCTCRCP
ncbi:hypothetical protein [Burkholderia plantarii]|uniref:hypothetical protein n=1 Tax=Burkholderia plantarii TaxID=41899 RepID=UPI001495D1D2|nr:hypothetical protein [Burkholderia plantarii]